MPASITLARMVALAFAAVPGSVFAGTLDYILYAGIERSDNITLSSTQPVSQNELIPGLGFTYTEQGSVLQANIIGALEYHDYPGNRFDSQTQTQLAGQVNWTVLPQRLDFSVMDFAGIQPVESLASNSPNNQQQTNVISLGPTLHLQFGNALRGQVELRYINSQASKVTDFDSSRGVAAFRLFRDLSPTDQLSANVEFQRVTFANSSTSSNYNRNEFFLGYTSKLAQFDSELMLGWSQLKFDHAPNESNPLVRVTVGWQPTMRSRFTVAGTYQYADAAQDMMLAPVQAIGDLGAAQNLALIPGQAFNGAGGGISAGNAVVDSQVYLERMLQVDYGYTTERLTLSIAPLYRKLHYLNDPTFDQVGRGGSFELAYRLRPTITLSAFATLEKLTYQSLDRHDRTTRYGLDLRHQWTPHWSWHASVVQQHRNSNAAGQSYHENEIFFGVVFRR